MAMKVIKCPDCGHELARVILGGGTNQTKSCAGCGSRFRIIKDSISPPTNFCMASRVLSSSISFGSSIGRSARTLIFSSFIVCLQIKTGQSKWIVL